jgi:hypothetical protein
MKYDIIERHPQNPLLTAAHRVATQKDRHVLGGGGSGFVFVYRIQVASCRESRWAWQA